LHDIVTCVRVFRVRQLAVLINSCGARAKDAIKQAPTPSARRVLMQPSTEATWQLQRIGATVAGASGQGPLAVERFQAPCVALRFTLNRTQYRVALLGDLRPQRGKLTFESGPPLDPVRVRRRRVITLLALLLLLSAGGIATTVVLRLYTATVALSLVVLLAMGLRIRYAQI
jgi:hypothetical protein